MKRFVLLMFIFKILLSTNIYADDLKSCVAYFQNTSTLEIGYDETLINCEIYFNTHPSSNFNEYSLCMLQNIKSAKNIDDYFYESDQCVINHCSSNIETFFNGSDPGFCTLLEEV